ncbi:MAG TPA: toxin HicA [Lentisphaeria bacterium]|nr:MAG: toxin HicA [Lentisphaerae bacterium GWF2_50_93]HCE46930.1 toxin HicA [Lentisphaeria bacterium]
MSSDKKILDMLLRGASDANIPFNGLRRLLIKIGFQERIKGSHHIYSMTGVEEIINIQSEGSKAKPYQVKQIRNIILKYRFYLKESK